MCLLGIEPHIYICLAAQECISKNDFQKSTSVQFKPSRSSELDHRTKQYFTLPKLHLSTKSLLRNATRALPIMFLPRFLFPPVIYSKQHEVENEETDT